MASWTVARLNTSASSAITTATTTTLETVPGATTWAISKLPMQIVASGGTSMDVQILAGGVSLFKGTVTAGATIPTGIVMGASSTISGYIDLVQAYNLGFGGQIQTNQGGGYSAQARNAIILNAADTISVVTTNKVGAITVTITYGVMGQKYA